MPWSPVHNFCPCVARVWVGESYGAIWLKGKGVMGAHGGAALVTPLTPTTYTPLPIYVGATMADPSCLLLLRSQSARKLPPQLLILPSHLKSIAPLLTMVPGFWSQPQRVQEEDNLVLTLS